MTIMFYVWVTLSKTEQTSQCWLKASSKLIHANKISHNVKKTEHKKFEGDLKIKLCGKRLYSSESGKYLGVKIDTNFSWQYHVNDLSIKLS